MITLHQHAPAKKKGYSKILLKEETVEILTTGFIKSSVRVHLKVIKTSKINKWVNEPILGKLVIREYVFNTLPKKYRKSLDILENHVLRTMPSKDAVQHYGQCVYRFVEHDKKGTMKDIILKKDM